MVSDSQVVLDVDVPKVMLVREKSKSGIWRTCGVLLAVALCAAAAVCFTLHQKQNKPDESQAEIKHSLRQISESAKAAIHLSGRYIPSVSNTSVAWFDNADQSFASGLKLEGNNITILRDGLYFVYSQASYRVNCQADNEGSEGQVVHMSHSISRWSDTYEAWKPLMSATRSTCKQTHGEHQSHWFGAIYLGAAFELLAGDKLSTVTDMKLLSKVESSGGKTFFGAFSL